MNLSQLLGLRFRIENPGHELLGRGDMGAVLRAADTLTGYSVAAEALAPPHSAALWAACP